MSAGNEFDGGSDEWERISAGGPGGDFVEHSPDDRCMITGGHHPSQCGRYSFHMSGEVKMDALSLPPPLPEGERMQFVTQTEFDRHDVVGEFVARSFPFVRDRDWRALQTIGMEFAYRLDARLARHAETEIHLRAARLWLRRCTLFCIVQLLLLIALWVTRHGA